VIWVGVVVTSLGCLAIKAVGYALPSRVIARPVVQRVAGLLPVALLAALAAQQTFAHGQSLGLDARVPAMMVAALAVWRRAPFLLVVVLAAATAALWRMALG